MSGAEVPIEWGGRRLKAWLPDPLSQAPPAELDAATVRLTERAAGAVVRVGDRLPAGWEPLARLLLRAEGMASSNIEGVRAPVEAVASAELGPTAGMVGWVADNLSVVQMALAGPPLPLTIEVLHAWHSRLMRNANLPGEPIGTFS